MDITQPRLETQAGTGKEVTGWAGQGVASGMAVWAEILRQQSAMMMMMRRRSRQGRKGVVF